MNNKTIAAVMIHAPCVKEGLNWYQKAFPDSVRHQEDGGSFEYIAIDGTALEVVQADSKVPAGAAGTVVYWHTENFEVRLNYLLSIGATLFRGPMDIEGDERMCQVLDPFGNPIGVRGSVSPSGAVG
jgi:predicted enzyme related to lactoylglutathione lyase